jgi:hypothetical protein
MSLIEQNDRHRIFTDDGYRDAHAFKLYVGEVKWDINGEKRRDPACVYLSKSKNFGKNTQFKMEIFNGEIKAGHWPPMDVKYFGKVSDLTFPFSGEVSAERSIAVTKFYFQLGFEVGLYHEGPGFKFTEVWQKHLRAACNDLMGVKQAKAVKAS